jgi:hypothetical protein
MVPRPYHIINVTLIDSFVVPVRLRIEGLRIDLCADSPTCEFINVRIHQRANSSTSELIFVRIDLCAN